MYKRKCESQESNSNVALLVYSLNVSTVRSLSERYKQPDEDITVGTLSEQTNKATLELDS